MLRPGTIVVVLLASVACTDTDLQVVVEEDAVITPRQQAQVTVCAPEPLADPAPYKILFVIDTSYSNSWTDPADANGMTRRERAVRQVITDHIDNPNVLFGVVTFADVPKRQTFGFTRDLQILNGAVENISAAQGGTNYSDTLWVATDFILADVAAVGEVVAKKTHYIVFWLSDGFPTVGVVQPTSILPGVLYLDQALADRVAEFQFNTAFLSSADASVPAADTALAKALLSDLATAGGGSFTDVAGDEEILFTVSLVPVLRPFTFVTLVASNRNARFHPDHPLADSDGDGLTDDAEVALALDPAATDVDLDGFGDGIEQALASEEGAVPIAYNFQKPDPLTFNDGCADARADTDRDGLSDCDEILWGTDRENADSDGDFVTDAFEARLGSSPLDDDAALDTDQDGMPDELEVRTHLDPTTHTAAEEISRWAYRYKVAPVPDTLGVAPPCWEVEIDNLWAFETLGVADRLRGVNEVELVAAFRPIDGQAPTVFKRAVAEIRILLAEDLLLPASGLLEVAPEKFVELPVTRTDLARD